MRAVSVLYIKLPRYRRKFEQKLKLFLGPICSNPNQFVCRSIGHQPEECVAKTLLCNGHRDCPASSIHSDEDEKMCRRLQTRPFNQIIAEQLEKMNVSHFIKEKFILENLSHDLNHIDVDKLDLERLKNGIDWKYSKNQGTIHDHSLAKTYE